METTHRPRWAEILEELRCGRAWSAMALARRLHDLAALRDVESVTRTQVGSTWRLIKRWERGDNLPSEPYRLLLAYAYASPAGRVATIEPTTELDQLLEAYRLMGVPVSRRAFIRSMAAAFTVAGLPAELSPDLAERAGWVLKHPDKVSLATVDWLARSVGGLMQQGEATIPYRQMVMELAPIQTVVRGLLEGSQPEAIRGRVVALGVQTLNFQGRIAFNLKDDQTAGSCVVETDRLLPDVPEGSFRRWYLANRARTARFRDLDLIGALDLAQTACRQIPTESNYVAFWVHCVLAEMQGLNHDMAGAQRSLDMARHFADRIKVRGVSEGDPWGFLFPEWRHGGYTTVLSRINAYEGTACLRGKRYDQAERAFGAVLTSLPEQLHTQRAYVLADLAAVRLRSGDLDGTCALLRQAHSLVENIGAVNPMRRIWRTRRELSPWRDSTPVRELDEQLAGPQMPL